MEPHPLGSDPRSKHLSHRHHLPGWTLAGTGAGSGDWTGAQVFWGGGAGIPGKVFATEPSTCSKNRFHLRGKWKRFGPEAASDRRVCSGQWEAVVDKKMD